MWYDALKMIENAKSFSKAHMPYWAVDLLGRFGSGSNLGDFYGPLARYVKSRVAHAPGMPGTFTPPPTSKETAS